MTPSPPRASGATARRVALDLLLTVEEHGAYANLTLPRLLDESRLPLRDRAFATELGYGALRCEGTLDHVIARHCDRPLADLDAEVRAALRLGTYQLWRMRVPAHAAVGETVGLVPQRARGFANAVLRRISDRMKGPDPLALQGLPPLEAIAIETAHPVWIVELFVQALGSVEEAASALAADATAPPVHLVALPDRMTADELAVETGGARGRFARTCVVLPSGDPAALTSVRRGAARVQDEGSQLCALALDAAMPDVHPREFPDVPGGPVDEVTSESLLRDVPVMQRVIDLCAGPGGKARLLGGLGGRRRQVDALELHEHRARLVRSTGIRSVVVGEGTRPPFAAESADAVIVDAPCSGLGALRRRPEARWRKSADEVPGLVLLQRELVAAALELVKPGGLLAYVVCSPVLEEAVLPPVAGTEVLDVPGLLGLPDDARAPEDPRRMQLWPHRHGTDAMSMTLLRRL